MLFRGRSLQYFISATANFLSILCGLHCGWPSPSLPRLLNNNSTISMTSDDGSWIASMFLIGSMCGAILTILLLDVIGRKKVLQIVVVPLATAWLMIAFARSVVELYVARFLAGISDGFIFCCLPVYLAEISDSTIRGLLISSTTVCYIFGVFLINLAGYFFNIETVAFTFLGLCLISAPFCNLIPESPQFFIIKGDTSRGRDVYEQLYENGNFDNLLNSMSTKQEKHEGRFLELFTDAVNRKSLFLVVILRIIQHLSGFLGILIYMQTLFEEAEKNFSPIVLIAMYYFLQIVMSVVNAAIIDRVGRRPLIISSLCVIIIALLSISAYFTIRNVTAINLDDYSWLPIFGLFLFIIGYTLGLQSISILLAGELFPLHVKAWGVGILDIFYGLFGVFVTKSFQYTKDELGIYVPFIAFTITTICSLPYVILCVPETKGKTLEEIQKELRVRQKPNT